MRKPIKFCINQLIIDEQEFSIESFQEVKDKDLDPKKLYHSDTGEEEITAINKVTKLVEQERFILFYFHQGDKFPYPPKVIKPDLTEEDNPRTPENIELREQFFVLADTKTQRLYLSDQRKRTFFKKWLTIEIKKEVNIKSIIAEEDFIKNIKSVNSISFTVNPNLFNSTQSGILSDSLSQDIYGFGAEKAKIEMLFGKTHLTDKIRDKIKSLIGRKYDFSDLVVVGRGDEGIETILNIEEVINKVVIDVNVDEKTEFFDQNIVFTALLEKILII